MSLTPLVHAAFGAFILESELLAGSRHTRDNFPSEEVAGPMSNSTRKRRHSYGGAKMIPDSVVVDVSQGWVVACEVQESFMEVPYAKTERLTYSARCRQMRALGGDCFSVLPLAGNRIALAIADASGKGLPAALLIANVQSSLRTAALLAPKATWPLS